VVDTYGFQLFAMAKVSVVWTCGGRVRVLIFFQKRKTNNSSIN
jgi:hypothetical protein